MKKNKYIAYAKTGLILFPFVCIIALVVLGIYHISQVPVNPVIDNSSEVIEDDVDFMIIPLPGGIPVGGGMYIW